MTRFLNVPLDVSDVFIMTFMILLDSYMEPTRVGSDYKVRGGGAEPTIKRCVL